MSDNELDFSRDGVVDDDGSTVSDLENDRVRDISCVTEGEAVMVRGHVAWLREVERESDVSAVDETVTVGDSDTVTSRPVTRFKKTSGDVVQSVL